MTILCSVLIWWEGSGFRVQAYQDLRFRVYHGLHYDGVDAQFQIDLEGKGRV